MLLEKIRTDIADFLKADPFFSNVEILLPTKGIISTAIEVQIAKLKLAVLLEIRSGKILFDDLGPNVADLVTYFTIHENVLLNRIQSPDAEVVTAAKTADDVLEELFACLNPARGISVPCVAQSFELLNDVGGALVYGVTATVRAGWKKTG